MMDPEIADQLRDASLTPLHHRLLQFARRRVDASRRHWQQRHNAWREAELLNNSFRDPDLQDTQTASDTKTQGVRKIVVPYTYATTQSMLAFLMSVFTQRKPIIPVEGKGPSDQRAAILMELLLDHQMESMEPAGMLVMYQWFFDALVYGVGIIKNVWTVREWPDMRRIVKPVVDPLTGQVLGYDDTVERVNTVAYEGNEAINITPFAFFPDHRRPITEFQKGEFCGHWMAMSRTVAEQKEAQGLYAGIDRVPERERGSSFGTDFAINPRGSSELARVRDMSSYGEVGTDEYGKPNLDVMEMWAFLHPDALGLPTDQPTSSTPELWVLTVANMERVIRAEPANLPARRFPFEILEPNYNVHAPGNCGLPEITKDMEYHLSWLWNSRMANVRKVINNEWMYNPDVIEERDIFDSDTGGGHLIRLKREYRDDPEAFQKAVHQFPVNDITAGHMQDANFAKMFYDLASGVNPMMMGQTNAGRRSATEVQGQLGLSAGRNKMTNEIFAAQGLKPWALQMARNTQVFVDLTHPLRVPAPYVSLLGSPLVQLTPEMLQGELTFPFTDAGTPTDRTFEANTLKEIVMAGIQTGAAQDLLATMPWKILFWRMMRALGFKDLTTFGGTYQQLVIQPDDLVRAQMQQGNLVPQQQQPGQQPEMPPQSGQASDGFPLPGAAGTPNVGNNGMGGMH